MRATRWFADPIVWLGAFFGGASTAYAVFAGRYLPYIDWGAHLGLISVLTHGGETGALEFFERSYAPSPYLLFYLAAAIIGQVVPVDVAAKVVLVLTAALLALGAASLADATDRDPRLSLAAPLAMFGLSMGWGFGSFVLATPVLLFALAAAERGLHAFAQYDRLISALKSREAIVLAVWLILLFNAHGFMFFIAVLAVGVRSMCFLIARPARFRAALRAVVAVVIGGVPAVLLMMPSVIMLVRTPSIEGGRRPDKLIELDPMSVRMERLAGDLLDRGSIHHHDVMWGAVAIFAAWLAWSIFRAHPRKAERRNYGMEIYAASLAAIYLFGPMTVEWPSSIWLIYPRFAVIAALMFSLLPMASLRGSIGTALALCPLILIGANAELNARHVREMSAAASKYDPVRELIPRGARVLQLTVPGPGEPQLEYHAMGALYAYLMVDGAAYVSFLFDKNELPVHLRRDRPPPRAPYWTVPHTFDPGVHGRDYDYLVLRGANLIKRTEAVGLHELVQNVNGWAVFRTKSP